MVKRRLNKIKRALTAGALTLGSLYACGKADPTTIVIPTQKPVASFTVNPKEGYAPLVACFDGSSSRAPGNLISKYFWSFGDGNEDSNSGMNVCHTYTTPGNYMSGLTVENVRGEKSPQTLDQIIAKDGRASVNIGGFSLNEDQEFMFILKGKITSPIYDASKLKVTATSPDLSITLYGTDSARVKNKTKDWNGTTYIDWNVVDPDGRQTDSRTSNVIVNPQTDIKGFLEHVLTGARISGIVVSNKTGKVTSNAQGEFSFQAVPNDTLEINFSPVDSTRFTDLNGIRFFTNQYYNVKMPLSVNGQDINFGGLQLIPRCKEIGTNIDCLDFMQNNMLPEKWESSDMPIPIYLNNPPSQAYIDAVRKAVMDFWPAMNQWLPVNKQISFQIVSLYPTKGVIVDHTTNPQESIAVVTSSNGTILKSIINSGSNYTPDFISNTLPSLLAHEIGHSLGFGLPNHSPNQNHLMYFYIEPFKAPGNFELYTGAENYSLEKGMKKIHSR